jgi:hypothetical protein
VSTSKLTAAIDAQSISQPGTVSIQIRYWYSKISSILSLTVAAASPAPAIQPVSPPQITTTALPGGQTGASYTAMVAASGGQAPYQWSLASGSLPLGLTINSSTGNISGTPTNAGTFSFAVRATDSLSNPASANLNIEIAGTCNNQPECFYGTGLGADALANTTVGPWGNTVSYRFRALHSGRLVSLRVYLLPDKTGYAAGTGGHIQVSVNLDDGTAAHNPSTVQLSSYLIANPLTLPDRYFPLLQFSSPPNLSSGQLYHVVFTNVDANPTVNYLSVDALYIKVPGTPLQPTLADTDSALLLRSGGPWAPRKGHTPILQLNYSDGWAEGIGYMETWVGAPRTVSATDMVRQRFTLKSSLRVRSVGIRAARLSGSDPLRVRLERADGTLVEQGEIPAGLFPSSSSTHGWATYTFAALRTLSPGETYHLVLQGVGSSQYQVFPVREGAAYGFSPTTFFGDGYAQFKEGSTWVGWTQWGVKNRTDGDLQFYFAIAP